VWTPANSDAARADAELAGAVRQLANARRLWLATHREPDGDAIGSLLGLGWLLRAQGKHVTLACQDPAPADVTFLPGVEDITTHGPDPADDLLVALDAGDLGRLGDLVTPAAWAAVPSLVVDHHASNTGFGTVNVIDASAASTAELVVRLADALGAPLDDRVATCLLAGIVTDTIGFRTPNTTGATLAVAQRLMAAGAPLAEITQQVFYRRPLPALRLAGRAVEHLELRGRCGVTGLSQGDLAELHAPVAEARGIASFLAGARELDVVAVLTERDDGTVDVSLRSRPGVNLVPVAMALGGGGHPQAAGARLALSLADAQRATWLALTTHGLGVAQQ
jgi:bifunctional oligoribonuclease and PAP phosphatase NrnA